MQDIEQSESDRKQTIELAGKLNLTASGAFAEFNAWKRNDGSLDGIKKLIEKHGEG